MLGIFKNKRKREVEAEMDNFLEGLADAICESTNIGVVCNFEIKFTKEGLKIECGGSELAEKDFKALGDGYDIIFDTVKEQLCRLAVFVNDSIERVSGLEGKYTAGNPEEYRECGCGKCGCDGNEL